MSFDDVSPRSRRAVLAAALGAAAATAASALGKPETVLGTDNQAVLAGAVNTATKATSIDAGAANVAFSAKTTGSTAIFAQAAAVAIWAENGSPGGSAVLATNFAATGRASGVHGSSFSAGGVGTLGASYLNANGILGQSTDDSHDLPVVPLKTGVHGVAMQDANSRGVFGKSDPGQGVRGESTTGIGVFATAPQGGTALSVNGRAAFSRSGRASVPANKRYVDVTIPGGFVSGTFVVATLQTYRSGVYVAVARNNYPSTGKCRIYLNKVASTSTSTTVGWIAVG